MSLSIVGSIMVIRKSEGISILLMLNLRQRPAPIVEGGLRCWCGEDGVFVVVMIFSENVKVLLRFSTVIIKEPYAPGLPYCSQNFVFWWGDADVAVT